MNHSDLPARWKDKLKIHLHSKSDVPRDTLSAYDFHDNIKISFEDESFAFFHYAFHLEDEEAGELAVFTEHCGYHIFPLRGSRVQLLRSVWVETEEDDTSM